MINRKRDFLWNNKSLMLPFISSVLCLYWLKVDPGPEPTVAFLVSILTFWSLYFQERDTWYTQTQGKLWVIVGRCGSQKNNDTFIKQTLIKYAPVAKYKVDNEGDFFTLIIDSHTSVKAEFLTTQVKLYGGKIYSITKNGKCIWQYEEP